jgi:Membrane bound O-acyl transferase family
MATITQFEPLLANFPRWAWMWVLAFCIYAFCKWLTWRATPHGKTPRWLQAGYLLAWPGMDAATFLDRDPERKPAKPHPREWLFAAAKLALGLTVLVALPRRMPPGHPYLAGWTGMIGIVMTLHFGLFHLLSCAWRQAGIRARPIMDYPLLAQSVSDFWGRRWNTAFRDLTHRLLFRPLSNRFGPWTGLLAGFLASGLVHDLVITVPAGGGYGGPTAYFVMQGVALLAERSRSGRCLGLGQKLIGWAFTMLVVLGPVALLFPRPFVLGVARPFLQAMGVMP